MPDLLDDLRRYGDAVEAAALDHPAPAYPVTAARADRHRRRPTRRAVLIGVAAALLLALVASIAVLRADDHDSVRIDTPPTTIPAAVASTPTPATVLPASAVAWSPLDPGPLESRFGQAVVWAGNELVVWGGTTMATGQDEQFSDGAAYDPGTNTWTMLPTGPLTPRSQPITTWTGAEVLIWGGEEFQLDGAAYDPTTSSWRSMARSPLPAGLEYSGTWTGSELLVIGAAGSVLRAAAYLPETDSWTELDPPEIPTEAGLAGRLPMATVGTRTAVFTIPSSSTEPARVLVFDVNTGDWTTSETPRALWINDPIPFENNIVSIARAPIGEGPIAFDPETDVWENWRSLPAFSCEGGHQLEPVGSRIFATACGISGFYDPSASTWQPVAALTEGSPEHVIWTGDRLLALGAHWADGDTSKAPTNAMWSLTP